MLALTSMLWYPPGQLSEHQKEIWKKRCTITPTSMFGEVLEPVVACSEVNGWFGVPRGYASQLPHTDQTVCKGIVWPAIQFPNGGSWRQGQEDAHEKLVEYFKDGNKEGRLAARCGLGKSLVSISVAAKLGLRVLVLVHKTDLVENWQSDASRFFPGVILGHVQGDEWRYEDAHITTCLAQTLWARKGKYPKRFVSSFDMIIIDEGHHFASNVFEYCLKIFPARYRLAVSATWRRKDGLEPLFDWHLGPIVTTMKATSLVGQYLMVPCNLNVRMHNKMPWARKLNLLATHASYTEWLANEIKKAVLSDRKVLIVSDRTVQLKNLQAEVNRHLSIGGFQKTTALFISEVGKVAQEKAKQANAIFATYQMISEGTDIPSLDTLFIASPRSDMEQTVGRIQRKCEGKKPLLIIDPYVPADAMMLRTAEKRVGWYKQLGFTKKV